MSDIWQQVLLVALLWVLLGAGAPGPRRAALAGLLLGVAVLLRLVAMSLVVPAVCYLIIAGGAWRSLRTWPGWRTVGARTLTFAAAFGVIIAGSVGTFTRKPGNWATRTTANVLYGRTAVVADCDRLNLDSVTALACPKEPLGQRRKLDDYAHIQREAPFRERFPPPHRSERRAEEIRQSRDRPAAAGRRPRDRTGFSEGVSPHEDGCARRHDRGTVAVQARVPHCRLAVQHQRIPRIQRRGPDRRDRYRRVSPRVPAQCGLHAGLCWLRSAWSRCLAGSALAAPERAASARQRCLRSAWP